MNGDGFLSEKGREKSKKIKEQNDERLSYLKSILHDINNFLTNVDLVSQKGEENAQKLFSIILAARLTEITEACILVFENGMSNESNTLFRVFLDAYFVFGNICEDKTFVKNYMQSDHSARLKLLNSARKHDSQLFRSINTYGTDEVKAEIEQLISQEKIQSFNSYKYADSIGCSEIYDCFYRITSANVHTTPRVLDKYVEEDEDGNVIVVKNYPQEGDIAYRIYDIAWFLIQVYSGLSEVFDCFNQEDIDEKRKILNEIEEKLHNE